jgi:hypothetical protein
MGCSAGQRHLGGQHPGPAPGPQGEEPPLPPVMTDTAPKTWTAFLPPQSGQTGSSPFAFSLMRARTDFCHGLARGAS